MIIKLLVEGGNMKPGPAIAQQLGPLGINMGKIISDVNSATTGFKGMNVPVHVDVNTKTKNFTIKVLSPPVSELIKKELKIETASGDRTKLIVGNLALEQLIAVTKQKQQNMLAKDFKSALTSVIGSCMSLGALIDSKDPKEILEEIRNGVHDKIIREQKTELSIEKKKALDSFFSQLQTKQQAEKKKAEEEAAAKEETKAEPGKEAPAAAETAKKEAKPAAAKPAAKK